MKHDRRHSLKRIRAADSGCAFDPSMPGTPDEVWQDFLSTKGSWEPAGGSLLVVSPHPDDETLGAGGLIRQWRMSGHEVTVLSVTDGEGAYPSFQALGSLRRMELGRALRGLLGAHVNLVRLAIPDGAVRLRRARLRNALRDLLVDSDTVVAPFENDGHVDHDAVGQVCLEEARLEGIPVVRYPVWAWHRLTPRALKNVTWGKYSLNQDSRRVKARSIRCFDSQLSGKIGPPIVPSHVLDYFSRPYEAFIL